MPANDSVSFDQHHKVDNKKSHELPMLREQWDTFKPGDIVLGDKGVCSYYDLSSFKDSVLIRSLHWLGVFLLPKSKQSRCLAMVIC